MNILRFLGVVTALLLGIFSIGGVLGYTQYNYTANGTHTVGAGIYYLVVEAWGAGGGGGGTVTNANGGAAGGGSGAYVRGIFPVTPGQQYNITVGTGGSGGTTAGSSGGNGGTSWFNNSNTLAAKGGDGGAGRTTTGTVSGGAGGSTSVSNGTIKQAGSTGGSGTYGAGSGSGGGGGAAGDMQDGIAGSTAATTPGGAGVGGYMYGGNGGGGRYITSPGAGVDGSAPGGGGSGSYTASPGAAQTGGAGARGEVRVWEMSTVPSEINITLYDENSLSQVTANQTANIFTLNNALTANRSTIGGKIYVPLETGSYFIAINGTPYNTRKLAFTAPTTRSVKNISMYMNNGSQITTSYIDRGTGAELPDVMSNMSRYIGGQWVVVETAIADMNGGGAFTYTSNIAYKFDNYVTGYAPYTFYINPIVFTTYTIRMWLTGEVENATYYDSLFSSCGNQFVNNENCTLTWTNGNYRPYYNVTFNYTNGTSSASVSTNASTTATLVLDENNFGNGANVTVSLDGTLIYSIEIREAPTEFIEIGIVEGSDLYIDITEDRTLAIFLTIIVIIFAAIAGNFIENIIQGWGLPTAIGTITIIMGYFFPIFYFIGGVYALWFILDRFTGVID